MGSLTQQIKNILRPIAKKRFLLERIKYAGETILTSEQGNDLISECVNRPGMAGKIGGTEMRLINRFLRRKDAAGFCQNFGRHADYALIGPGIYPNDPATLSRFCSTFLESLRKVDLLAVWFNFGEARVRREYAPHAKIFGLQGLEPFFHPHPWSRKLAGKRVVVVTPFAKTTLSQYARREKVWENFPGVLPEFSLRVIRCPQSAGIIDKPEYPDWFTGLEALKAQLAEAPFDVAMIGAGAWSIPLAAHAKDLGAFGIHLGGAMQLMFGIMGARWKTNPEFARFVNDAWTSPSTDERPSKTQLVENACYW